MNTIFRYSILFSLIIAGKQLCAQQPTFRNFNYQHGFPSNTVFFVHQDQQGYIWFTTNKGVVKFTGKGFETMNTSNGLGDNEIYTIYEDTSGTIWFPCNNGELSFYKNGRFYNRNNSKLLARVNNSYMGLKVLGDKNGNIFYLTQKQVILINDGTKKNIVKNDPQKYAYSTLISSKSGQVYCIEYTANDVNIINLTTNAVINFSNQEKKVMPRVNTKAEMINDRIYYGTDNKLVVKQLNNEPATILRAFSNIIQSVQAYDNDNLWIGTQKGLFLMNINTGSISEHWFKESSISHVLEDKDGNYWVSTLNNGVYLITNTKLYLFNSHNKLTYDHVHHLKVLDTVLMSGSSDFKFSLLHSNNVINFELPPHVGNGVVKTGTFDKDHNYYILTSVNMMSVNNKLQAQYSRTIASKDMFINNDTVYCSTSSGTGIFSLQELRDPGTNMEALSFRNVVNKNIANFLFISDQDVFFVGNSGIGTVNKKGHDPFGNDDKFKKSITDVCKRDDSTFAISSSISGVKIIIGKQNFYMNTENGFCSDYVTSLIFDDVGHLWAGTSAGLCEISIGRSGSTYTFQTKRYTVSNGLMDNTVNDLAWFENKIWVGTNSGLCSFKKQDLTTDIPKPKLIIEDILIADVSQTANSKELTTPFKENNLTVKYTALSSNLLSDISYEYRMIGLDSLWRTTTQAQLNYPALQPGSYTLQIRALNPYGPASDIQHIALRVEPAFYQTLWFRLIVLFVLSSVIILLIQYRMRIWRRGHAIKESLLASENKRLELEKEEAQLQNKLLDLEQKALRLHMNPHFIFNAINAIHGFYMSGETDNAKRYITKFSQLLRTLLESSTLRFISLQKEEEMLTNYCSLNELRFPGKFKYTIECTNSLNKDNILIPPMILQPFVENALLHGIGPMKDNGVLKISFSCNDRYLFCEVRDNGIGRKASRELNAHRIHTSTGIKVTEERIRAHFTAAENELPLEIIDLENELGVSEGTIVKIKLNLYKNI